MTAPLAFIEEVSGAIAQSSMDRRAGMLRRITDYFLVESDQYSDKEIAVFDEVFIRLVETIEQSSRALLAIRLGPVSKAPPKILRVLACDNAIEVASPVLIHADGLDDTSLVECAKTRSQEHLLAISCRKILSEAVTDVLVERGDQQIALSTAKNAGARFSHKGFAILVKRSNDDDQLALAVGVRPDIPLPLFQQLLEMASTTVRSKLEAENPKAKRAILSVVTDVTKQISAHAASQPPIEAAAQVLVDSLSVAGQLSAAKIDQFARAHLSEELVFALSRMADAPIDFVKHAMTDPQSLLVLCKAIDLSWEITRNILASNNKNCSLREIERYTVAYQRLDQTTSQQIISFRRTQDRHKRRSTLPLG